MTNELALEPPDFSTVAALLSPLDSRILERVRKSPSAKSNKYLEADHWLATFWAEACELGLHEASPRRILDIGTGPGYFPYVCRTLGHDCIGLDQPDRSRPRVYKKLCAWLGTEVVLHRIRPFEPLPPFTKKFDLVTAFRAPFFNVMAEERSFTLAEWAFFLDDLRDNVLRSGGSFSMRMNKKDNAFAGPTKGDPELTALFISRGATVELGGKKVHFREVR